MKAQSSIEFIVLLSAVAIFMVFVLGEYSHIHSAQQTLFSKIANYSVEQKTGSNSVFSYNQSLYLSLIVPNISYVNKSNGVQIVLSYPGSYRINSLSINASAAVLPASYSNLNYSNMGILSFSMIPFATGSIKVTAIANITAGTKTIVKSISSYTYSEQQSTNSSGGGPYYSAYITNRIESLLYPLSTPANLVYYNSWEHCNYLDDPTNEIRNCGATNWGVRHYDIHCSDLNQDPWTRYMWECISPTKPNYSASTISPTQSYNYGVVLDIKNGTTVIRSNLSSASTNAPLIGANGRRYGYSIVNNVSGQSALPLAYQNYVVLFNGTRSPYAVNRSAYNNYTRNSSVLLNLLNQYNGQVVAPNDGPNNPIYNEINGNRAGADYWHDVVVLSPAQALNGCGGFYSGNSANYFVCKSQTPFYYNITATINGRNPNMTLLAQGSIIDIK